MSDQRRRRRRDRFARSTDGQAQDRSIVGSSGAVVATCGARLGLSTTYVLPSLRRGRHYCLASTMNALRTVPVPRPTGRAGQY